MGGSIPADHADGCSSPGTPFCTSSPRGQPWVGPGWSSACPPQGLGELWRMRGGLPRTCRAPGQQCWDVAVASGQGSPSRPLSSSPSRQPCCSRVEWLWAGKHETLVTSEEEGPCGAAGLTLRTVLKRRQFPFYGGWAYTSEHFNQEHIKKNRSNIFNGILQVSNR